MGIDTMKPKRLAPKGWFLTRKNLGDRTIQQQMIGLDTLLRGVRGKTVLDIGCAEGLISLAMLDHGALLVHGVDIVLRQIHVARLIAAERPVGTCGFIVADVNTFVPEHSYDIVLMLGILHKLIDPEASCRRFASIANKLCVIRIPPAGFNHSIKHRTSGVTYDLDETMAGEGFVFLHDSASAFGEVTLYYQREGST